MVKLPDLSHLSSAQRMALRHADDIARRFENSAVSLVTNILRESDCTLADYNDALECIRSNARVVVHFHPDRLGRTGKTVAESLLEDGIYRNQFDTGLSSGSLSGFPGGERDLWEKALFGGAYHTEGVSGSERPKYGSLELIRYPGFQLAVREVPDDFRGPAMPGLARRIAGIDGTLDASVIGSAAASLYRQPENWLDWGSSQETLQHLKQLWHVLVHCGLPILGTAQSNR